MNNSFFLHLKRGEDALYDFKLSNLVSPDYVPFGNDAIKLITIQVIIQFMLLLKEQNIWILLNFDFLELLIYVVLGLAFYWFVMRKFIVIT